MKCEFCETEVSPENCALAVVRRKEDEKEYAFCCIRCVEASKKK